MLIAELQRRGDGPHFLWGQSLGGGLVLNYTLFRRPSLQGVIATSPLLVPTVLPPAWKHALAHVMSWLWPRCTLRGGVDPHSLSHVADAVRRYQQDPLVHSRVSAILGTSMLEAGRKALKHADQLALPLLLMHGCHDQLTSAESSRAFAQRAGALCTLQIWEGLFHELHFETEGERVVQRICDWIRAL